MPQYSLSCMSEIRAQLGADLDSAVQRAISDASRCTYRSGVVKWAAYVRHFKIPDDLFSGDYPRADVQAITQHFVVFLRGGLVLPGMSTPLRRIRGSTVDQYVSHVVRHIFETEWVDNASALFRTRRSAAAISGFCNEDHLNHPQRLSCRIPLSADLMVKARVLSRQLYGSWSANLQLCIDAAFALGFALCLRACEYLLSLEESNHVLLSHHAAFKWNADARFFQVTRPDLYPLHLGPPDFFVQLPNTLKNDQWGKGGPSAVARAPLHAPFCCVTTLFAFFQRFPPRPNQPVLSGSPSTISVSFVNKFTRRLAIAHSLDPDRLLSHSIRVGSVNQLESLGIHTQQVHGRWNTPEGLSAYTHASLAHASRVSAELHNPAIMPVELLRFTYMSPHRASPDAWPHDLEVV